MNRQPITARSELERIIFDETAEPKALRLSLLEDITNGFSDDNEIGYGGFARVYKGMLDNGKVVALKKLFGTVDIDEKKFIQEVRCLMKAKQKNIVRFLGYCSDTQGEMLHFEGKLVLAEVRQKVLCFEYLPNGSLDKQIADASCGLEWTKRYQIITGICDGLHYLHQKRILHLDLKPANILLDDNMMPKITDFGLSRIFDEKQSRAITSKLIGTLGYLAPELYGGHITFKLDIYSLGIIIIEMLIGEKGYPNIDNVLETWRNRLEKTQREAQLVQVRVCTEIAIQCTHSDPAKRPDTQHIVDRLGAAKSVDESAAETGASCCSLVMQETGSTICLENTMANEVNKLAEELYNIKVQNRRFSSMPENSSIVHHITDIRETPSNVEESLIIGRAEEKKKLMAALSGSITPEFTVLPIYGIGGIGKTTLAQLVFNDSQFIGYSRVWVSGQNLDLNKIGNSIISQLSEESLIAEKQMIDNHLKELLSGKKILIVLDDVWEKNPDTINTLKAMLRLGASSSVTTIVTTRNEAIAREICHTVDPYKLETLTDKICWTIIKQKTAFKERVDKKQLKHIGREIAIKCGGVALAAQSLGYTLNGKTSDEWESVRDNSIWNISTSEDPSSRNHEVLASLLLSFTHMSECLKLCFSYLAVYPKGHSIMKCDLIYQWITLGFIGPSSLFDSVQLCEIFITELLGMSFLQYSKTRSSDGRQDKDITSFTMPDLVHDLARNVLANLINISRGNRNTCALLTDSSKPLQSSMISPANLEALHFVDCGKIELLGGAFSPANRILVSDLRACLHVMVKIGSLLGSVITLSNLEHRDLSWDFVLSSIPKSFDLGKVRALDLKDCIDVKDGHLKYISQLWNLMYLSLLPDITEIPTEIAKLKLLETLDVTSQDQLCQHHRTRAGHSYLLKSLKLHGNSNLATLPKFVDLFQNLTNISISTTVSVPQHLLSVLGEMPTLLYLKITASSIEDGGFVIQDGKFVSLKCLCLVLIVVGPSILTIQDGGAQDISSLQLICKDLVGLSDVEIRHLPVLEEIVLHQDVDEETRQVWEAGARNHPNRPYVSYIKIVQIREEPAAVEEPANEDHTEVEPEGNFPDSNGFQVNGAHEGKLWCWPRKRKLARLLIPANAYEEDIADTNMKDAGDNLAASIHDIVIDDEVHKYPLYLAVMTVPGFPGEALLVAVSHLIDNKAQGSAYMGMHKEQRVLWLRNFLGKHY